MDKFLTYQGIRLHYTLTGVGQPLFLLHGWSCDGTIWKTITPFLEQHFQLYTVDFAGAGQSEEPHEVWGVEEYTRSLEAIAQHEGVSNPILIGHSFGGRVAILFASRNACRKIVLTDAAGVKPKRSLTYYRKVYTYKLLKRLAPIFLGRKRAEQLIEKRRAKSGSKDYNSATPMMRAILSKVVNEDLCHVMPLIKAPTLLFWGDRDTATPLSDAQRMEKLIPDAGLVIAQGTGHFSFLENTPLYLRVLESFLSNEINKR